MNMKNISTGDFSKDYSLKSLFKRDLLEDPLEQFQVWFEDAVAYGIEEANVMTLATSSKEGRPSSRTVLLKSVNKESLVFYSNYESRKGRDLAENPYASLTFWWKEMERQVCMDGSVEKSSREESEEYFYKRPLASQIAAVVSRQSSIIESGEELKKTYKKFEKEHSKGGVVLPDYWGGYCFFPYRIEFWQGRPSRLHDRISYFLEAEKWKAVRLSP